MNASSGDLKMFDIKEYRRKYYLANQDKIKERVREYRKNNIDLIKIKAKEYRQRPYVKLKHRKACQIYSQSEKGKKKHKEYYETHKEELLKKCKEYKKKHPEIKKGRKEYDKKYHKKSYPKRRDKILKYGKEYRQRPEVKVREKLQKQIYYLKNKERIKKVQQRHYNKKEVKEKIKKRFNKYRKDPKNKGKIKVWVRNGNKQKKIKENKRRKKLGLSLVGEGYKRQKELLIYLQQLFPNQKILFNKMVLDDLQLDIYIPNLKIAFEYQGYQHYIYPNFYHKSLNKFINLVERDKRKKELCNQRGITLIEFPYFDKLSLSNVITKLNEVNIKTNQLVLTERFLGNPR